MISADIIEKKLTAFFQTKQVVGRIKTDDLSIHISVNSENKFTYALHKHDAFLNLVALEDVLKLTMLESLVVTNKTVEDILMKAIVKYATQYNVMADQVKLKLTGKKTYFYIVNGTAVQTGITDILN